MKRKSPFKHKVRSHKRNNKPVDSYVRGKGEAPVKISDPSIRSKKMSGKPEGSGRFNVRVLYDRLQTERFPVVAASYSEAIERALVSRVSVEPPVRVEVVKG